MPITINTYCRVNRNGSININTDPLFGFTTTSTTTTTTTINLDNFACVSSAGVPVNGTYQFYDFITVNEITRPRYLPVGSIEEFSLQISIGIGVWSIYNPGEEIVYYIGNTNPAPAFPWLETSWRLGGGGSNPLPTVNRGPC